MSILSYLLGQKKKTAGVAKERLQIILAHERSSQRDALQPDYWPGLQRELIDVISKYIRIDSADIKVSLDRHDDLEVLEVNIPLTSDGRGRIEVRRPQ
ncbi:MAG: cell division topological specificity factor MinE [Pseudomonadota bacterium]|jgi:cell division topological specificity factor